MECLIRNWLRSNSRAIDQSRIDRKVVLTSSASNSCSKRGLIQPLLSAGGQGAVQPHSAFPRHSTAHQTPSSRSTKMVCAKCAKLSKSTTLATPGVKKKSEMYYGSPAGSSKTSDKTKTSATLGNNGIGKASRCSGIVSHAPANHIAE